MTSTEPASPAQKIPQVSILHGDDEYGIQQEIKRLQAVLGLEASQSDTSIMTFENRAFDDGEVEQAALTLDLFSSRRLVVLKNPIFPRPRKKKSEEDGANEEIDGTEAKISGKFINLLETMPEGTNFVIAVEDQFKGGREKGKWSVLGPGHWLTRWAAKSKGKAGMLAFKLPEMWEMSAWIQAEAVRQGGKISPQAAAELSLHFGNETRILNQEIAKLLTYVNRERPVDVEDVKGLSNYGGEGNIFALSDAIANGDTRQALVHFHLLLQDNEDSAIFAMIVRLFRQLILTQEMAAEQKPEFDIASELKVPDFAAKKLVQQSHRFTPAKLSGIYHRLLEMDAASKTNAGMTLETAIDTFILEMGRR